MIKWISRIHWGKVFLIALLYTIIATVIRQLEMIWTLKYYMTPQYFGVWSKLMMPSNGPPPFEFMVTSMILTFASGMALTIIYYYLRDYLPKGFWHRATFFADVLVSTSFIFFTLPVYLLFNVPLALLGYWFVSTFVVLLLTSILIVKIIK
jgi:uncharacterized membrane protein